MRVLITSGYWQAALNCVQSLGRLGHEVYLLDPAQDPPLARSRYCRGHLRCPEEYQSPQFFERLMEVVATGHYDLLIPISDRVMDVVAHYRDQLSEHVRLVLPEPKQLEVARDKARTTRLAESLGIRVPESHFPADLSQVGRLVDDLDYPVVVKIPRSTAGNGVFVARRPSEVLSVYRTHGRPDNWPFIQRFVSGDIADVAAVCDHGELVAHFSFYAYSRHLVGGTPPYLRSLADPALVDLARRLVGELDWHGAIDLDFIMTSTGEYYLLEINPRFSGSTNFAYKLGIDLPKSYLDLARGVSNQRPQRGYSSGWAFRTVFPAEVDWWRVSKARRARTVLGMTLRPRTRSNLYWRDWRLIQAQLREAIGQSRR